MSKKEEESKEGECELEQKIN